MFDRQWKRERDVEAQADWRSFWAIVIITAGYAVVNITSRMTELERSGNTALGLADILIFEGGSGVIFIALTPVLIWLTRLIPLTADTWRWALPAYMALSVPLSGAHIVVMVWIRKAAFAIRGEFYRFSDNLPRDIFYEYRKDLLSLALIVMVIQVSRELALRRREAAAAREDARRDKRLTLKCGGRTIWMAAEDLIAAKAAGNYVEIKTETGEHLARTTLGALERQLDEAGIRAARVHRSYLVNLDKILEAAPTGSGDLSIRMKDGSEIPGSRRFREKLDAA